MRAVALPIMPRVLIQRASGLVTGDAGLLLLARLMQNANGFLLSVVLVRQFGLAAAGTATLATVAVTVLALLGSFGLPFSLARDDGSIAQRNTVGLAASALAVPLAAPAIVLYAWLVAHDAYEAAAVGLLSLGGLFFAQSNILTALLLLQGRARLAALPPFANLAGLCIAALATTTLTGFALVLAAFRLAGIAIVFAQLPLARVAPRAVLARLRAGSAFLTTDAINLGSEQVVVIAASYLIPREALGILGLCRQLLTLAETPGWSFVQARYPELVAKERETFPALWRQVLTLSLVAAAMMLPLSWFVGAFVYRVDALIVLMPVLLLALPGRYLVNLCEQTLRSAGEAGLSNRAAACRLLLSAIVLPCAATLAGVWGIIGSMVPVSYLGLLVAIETVRRVLPAGIGLPQLLPVRAPLPAAALAGSK